MAPQVGGQHFSYSGKGMKAAKAAAAKTGQPMKMSAPPKKAPKKK